MPEYQVEWIMDIEADSPGEAARKALRIQRDPTSIATVFEVYARDENGRGDHLVDVDLAEIDNTPEPVGTGRVVVIDIGHDFVDSLGATVTHPADHVRDVASDFLTAAGFDGHTITTGIGCWRGDREQQTTARVYLTAGPIIEDALAALRVAAGKIRDYLRQESVGFTVTPAEVEFI